MKLFKEKEFILINLFITLTVTLPDLLIHNTIFKLLCCNITL